MSLVETLSEELRANRAVQVLAESKRRGRMAHAMLLEGSDLKALEQVACALAAELLKTDGNPLQHPDLFTLRPQKKSRQIIVGEKGELEGNTMRRLIHDLQQSANQGGAKVAIIYEADRMNGNAANAFLKTLEEPPRETTLLLLTTRPYDLLPTIRSRCFRFRIETGAEAVSDPEWLSWLDDYRAWLTSLETLRGGDARTRAASIMALYGLSERFMSNMKRIGAEAWEAMRESLDDSIDADERDAFERGMLRGTRDALLKDIEEHTRLYAIEASQRIPYPAQNLAAAVEAMEHMRGLLAVNLSDEAAFETFMLRSLRIWALN